MLLSMACSVRRLILPIALISTLASHGLTLLLPNYHALLTNALSHVMPNINAHNKNLDKLKKDNAKLKDKNKALDRRLTKHSTATTKFTDKLKTRLVRNVAVNTGSVLTESIPLYGAAVVVGVTAMDVTDACSTMNDINELLREVGQEPDIGQASKVCSSIDKIPSAKEIAEYWFSGVATLKSDTTARLQSLQTKVDASRIELGGFLHYLKEEVKLKWTKVIIWLKTLFD